MYQFQMYPFAYMSQTPEFLILVSQLHMILLSGKFGLGTDMVRVEKKKILKGGRVLLANWMLLIPADCAKKQAIPF